MQDYGILRLVTEGSLGGLHLAKNRLWRELTLQRKSFWQVVVTHPVAWWNPRGIGALVFSLTKPSSTSRPSARNWGSTSKRETGSSCSVLTRATGRDGEKGGNVSLVSTGNWQTHHLEQRLTKEYLVQTLKLTLCKSKFRKVRPSRCKLPYGKCILKNPLSQNPMIRNTYNLLLDLKWNRFNYKWKPLFPHRW